MVGSILAGKFAWDIITFVLNKLMQFIITVCTHIFSGLRFIANKIISKLKMIRDECRRKGIKVVADLNYKIKIQT